MLNNACPLHISVCAVGLYCMFHLTALMSSAWVGSGGGVTFFIIVTQTATAALTNDMSTFDGCLFKDNYNTSPTVCVVHATVTRASWTKCCATHRQRRIQGVVGAIFAMAGVEVRNCVFRNNSAELGAAVFVNNVEAKFSMDGCVFDNNTATVRSFF